MHTRFAAASWLCAALITIVAGAAACSREHGPAAGPEAPRDAAGGTSVPDGSNAGSGGPGGASSAPFSGASGQAGAPGSVGVDSGSMAGAGDSEGVATDEVTVSLVEQPGERSVLCSVTRELEPLGISPWGDGVLVTTAEGVQLIRPEGELDDTMALRLDRLVGSSLDTNGVLGAPILLAGAAGMTYGVPSVRVRSGTPHLVFAVGPSWQQSHFERLDLAGDGTPLAAATPLMLEIGPGFGVSALEDGYLRVRQIFDVQAITDAGIWTQRLDASGAPIGSESTVVVASEAQPMVSLGLAGMVADERRTALAYRWFAASGRSAGDVDVDISHYRVRIQLLDGDGRALLSPHELVPEIASHIEPQVEMTVHDGYVLAAWTELERMPDANMPMGWSGAPLWSAIRVARIDETGAPIEPVRTVLKSRPGHALHAYWVELSGDAVGLGFTEQEVPDPPPLDLGAIVPTRNHFVVLAADLQSAKSEVVSFGAGEPIVFGTRSAERVGDEILVLGAHYEGFTQGAASGTLRCVQ